MAVPRFNPGVPDVNLRQITHFSPTGTEAQAQLWGQVSAEFAKVGNTFSEIESRRVQAQQETMGKVAAGTEGFDPAQLKQGITAADRAFYKGAVASYMSRMDIDTNTSLANINAETYEDPSLMQRRMRNYVDSVAARMPVDIALQYKEGAMRIANNYFTNSVSAAAGRARSQQKDDIQAGIELSERRLKELGVPTTPAAQAAYEQEAAVLKTKQDAAVESGIFTPNQIAVRNQVLKEDLEDGTIYEAVSNQPGAAKFDFAMKVAEGKSGTGLDLLPPDRRYRAVQVAQTMLNAEKAQEDMAEKTRTRAAEAAIWDTSELAASDPRNPATIQKVNQLMTLANTPETVTQAAKLRNFVANPDDPRFLSSNKEYKDYLELEAARGSLTQTQVDTAWGSDSINTRISTNDRQALSQMIKVRPKGIMGTNAWDTFVGKLEAQFPVRERRRTGMSALFAQLGLDVPNAGGTGKTANGLTEGQMKANEGLVKQILMETQEKISNGDITSESSLTEYGGRKIAELRQQYGLDAGGVANQKVSLTPAKQGAYLTIQNDATMQQMFEKYKKDRAAFARDAATNQLDIRTINTISTMLEGE